jgi:sugar phosphate isomerase/epimerase
MFVGFLTAPVRDWSFKKLVGWASDNGFKGLEVSVSPGSKQVDVDRVLKGGAGGIRSILKGTEVKITGLAFYSIGILKNPKEQKFFEKVMDACSVLDVNVACTLAGGPVTGKDKIKTLKEDFPGVFNPLVDKAKKRGLKIAMENWFATNLQGLNHFQTAFDAVPDNALGLNFDPSHLFWQQIDYIEAVHRFSNRIFHTHAKDTEIMEFRLRQVGVLGGGWWKYRIPGWGRINWPAYLAALREVNYDYVLSIEHEDPFFTAEDGFLKGKRFLESII